MSTASTVEEAAVKVGPAVTARRAYDLAVSVQQGPQGRRD